MRSTMFDATTQTLARLNWLTFQQMNDLIGFIVALVAVKVHLPFLGTSSELLRNLP